MLGNNFLCSEKGPCEYLEVLMGLTTDRDEAGVVNKWGVEGAR